ncbi:hypothetical protein TRFO_16669 [Tritrichomonas foetus]|uniref:Uncharacterized protein n=1 Tax=Tritrichomonas foetus TaxID=1144522 RepID=A0A1J4KU93_9EUKA|nr:hypothetical protein TRFO_16669 [Tritrichomonas foetus]|eukprot:OHT13230.1 hypothetical protein TRFO_16669 [Tritrichomonas foetus]
MISYHFTLIEHIIMNFISQKSMEDTKKIIEYQNILLDISPETIVTAKEYFCQPGFFDIVEIKDFLEMILIFGEIRPLLIPLYCDLLLFINDSVVPIKTIFLNLFFRASNCDESVHVNSHKFYFLRQIMMKKLFTPIEIVKRIVEYSNAHSPQHFYSSSIFCYFMPEIKENNLELYVSFLEIFNNEMKYITAPECLHDVFMNFNELTENDFELYHNKFAESQNTFLIVDDVVNFVKNLTDINMRIRPSIFGIPPFLQNMPTIIQCAAFYGAIKCFKYLFLNGADLTMKDGLSRSVVHFAVAGGNLEIIHLLEQQNASFDDTLQYTAQFHRHEIFMWIIDKHPKLIDKLYDNGIILCKAAVKANLDIMLFCFENNVDVNKPDDYGWTPLHYASRDNIICSMKLLLSHKDIDVNVNNNGNTSPLQNAVINGRYDAVDCLLNHKDIDVNQQTKDGVLFPIL